LISFGTDGWRAIIADTFTFDNVRIVTQAIANYLLSERREKREESSQRQASSDELNKSGRQLAARSSQLILVVGYDNRFMAEEFADVVSSVLAANGVGVFLSGEPTPTATVAFAVKSRKLDGAVMLTASHNPSYYNGIKFIPFYAGPATKDITIRIEEEIRKVSESKQILSLSRSEAKSSPLINRTDITRDYFTEIKKLVDFGALEAASLKVVLDPLYGAGANLFPYLCRDAGLNIKAIHNWRDPLFGGSLPDPSAEHLEELASTVLTEQADLGLALDGDADRIGIISDDGTFVSANQAVSLLLIHLIKNKGRKGVVVRTVATTHLIDAIAKNYHLEVVETPVGFKHIGQLMRERDVIIGGEESGGLSIGGYIPEKDGILANLLMCEMVAMDERKLSVILKDVRDKYGSFENLRLDIPFPRDRMEALLSDFKANPPAFIAEFQVQDIITKDGMKFLLKGENWLLIRPSGTEPLVRCYLETHTMKDLERLKNATLNLLKA
jgi:phosphomannomutase